MKRQCYNNLYSFNSFLVILLVLTNVAYAKKRSSTVLLSSDVSAQWQIEGPCTGEGEGNALVDPHTICFFSLSQQSQTFDLELDMGETGSSISLPNFPFLEYGSTCTTYVYREAGTYNNTFSALVSGGSKVSIEFNIPWNIYPNGTCSSGPTTIETEEGVPAGNTGNDNIFNNDGDGGSDGLPVNVLNQAEASTSSSAAAASSQYQYQKNSKSYPHTTLLFGGSITTFSVMMIMMMNAF